MKRAEENGLPKSKPLPYAPDGDTLLSALRRELKAVVRIPDQEVRRLTLVALLHDAIFLAQTEKEDILGYWNTAEHVLRKQVEDDSVTVAEFRDEVDKVIADWQNAPDCRTMADIKASLAVQA